MTRKFKVELFFDSTKSKFQDVMNRLFEDYLKEKTNFLTLGNENNKIFLNKVK